MKYPFLKNCFYLLYVVSKLINTDIFIDLFVDIAYSDTIYVKNINLILNVKKL